MADISKIKLPSGTTYDIKDAIAREMAAGTIKIKGTSKTALTDGATTNPIYLDDGTSTGVSYTAIGNDAVFYGNKEFVFDGTTWHEFGDMSGIGEMGKVDQGTVTIKPKGTNAASSVSFATHTTDKVLGEATTFTNAASSVSFGNHTTATVLKSSVTATVPKTSSTTKYLSVSGSVATSGSALTDLGDPTTDSFVKSYPGTTSKLTTTSVTGVQSSTTTASKATAGTAVAVAKAGTAVTTATGSLGTETTTRTANTPMWGASVENETLSFTFKPLSTTSVTPAVSNGNITPYTFADVTVPIKNSSATTVATGAVAAGSSGATVMTGLGTPTTGNGVTGYSPSSSTFAKTVSASLSSASSTSTGAVKYVESVSTSGTDAVTFATSGNTADAITALGAGTAAAQTITVGTNDKVTAITALGAGTAAAQTFTGTQETYTVNPKTS